MGFVGTLLFNAGFIDKMKIAGGASTVTFANNCILRYVLTIGKSVSVVLREVKRQFNCRFNAIKTLKTKTMRIPGMLGSKKSTLTMASIDEEIAHYDGDNLALQDVGERVESPVPTSDDASDITHNSQITKVAKAKNWMLAKKTLLGQFIEEKNKQRKAWLGRRQKNKEDKRTKKQQQLQESLLPQNGQPPIQQEEEEEEEEEEEDNPEPKNQFLSDIKKIPTVGSVKKQPPPPPPRLKRRISNPNPELPQRKIKVKANVERATVHYAPSPVPVDIPTSRPPMNAMLAGIGSGSSNLKKVSSLPKPPPPQRKMTTFEEAMQKRGQLKSTGTNKLWETTTDDTIERDDASVDDKSHDSFSDGSFN
jgi:hypothetical protein